MWFTEQGGNRVARITPGGTVTEFSVGISLGALPSGITGAPTGIWFTEPGLDRIGRVQ